MPVVMSAVPWHRTFVYAKSWILVLWQRQGCCFAMTALIDVTASFTTEATNLLTD
jgi:hypothetical protein